MSDQQQPRDRARSHRSLLLWLLVLLTLAYLLSLRWEPPVEEVVTARWTSSDQGQPAELVAHGWLPTNKIQHDRTLRFWISFENRSDSNVLNLRFVELQAPGFTAVGKCWRDGAPACVDGTGPRPLPIVLKPRETATVLATLQAVAKSGRYSPVAVFAWSSPRSGGFRKSIALGPIEVTTWWREAILLSARRLHMLVRDLALPLLVVLVGLFFERKRQIQANEQKAAEQRQESERKDAEQRQEKLRREAEQRQEAQRRTADEFRAQILQTWSQLLQQFLQDTRRYYLPMNSRLSTLRRVTRQHRQGKPIPVREHFFYFLTFMRQTRHLVESIGGLLFKNRDGENLASSAWLSFLQKVDSRFESARRWRALDAIAVSEGITQFEARLAEDSDNPARDLLLELEEVFKKWRMDTEDPFSRTLPLLDLLYQVTHFEINRPFEYWYGTPEVFPGKTLRAIGEQLSADDMADLRKELQDYLNKEVNREGERTAHGTREAGSGQS